MLQFVFSNLIFFPKLVCSFDDFAHQLNCNGTDPRIQEITHLFSWPGLCTNIQELHKNLHYEFLAQFSK